MLILLSMLSAAASIAATDPKPLARQSFDERLDAIHAVRRCYYDNIASAPTGSIGDKARWLRAKCAGAEASDVAVWTRWLPDLKEQIPAAAEHNHQVIAEEVVADPSPEPGLPTP